MVFTSLQAVTNNYFTIDYSANHFLDSSINRLVYKTSKNCVNSQLMSLNVRKSPSLKGWKQHPLPSLRDKLKETYCVYVQVHNCCSTVFPPSKHSVWAPVSFGPRLLNTQSAVIGQLTHAWASTANNNIDHTCAKSILTCQTSHKQIIMQMHDMAMECDVTKSQTTDKV